MAQWLGVLAPGGPGFNSHHSQEWLTTSINSRSRASDIPFWPPGLPARVWNTLMQIHTPTQQNINEIKDLIKEMRRK